MVHIVYSDNKEPFTGRPVPYHRQNANGGWLKHYANFRYLKFIFDSTTDRNEKHQANKEIQKAQEKMNWWKRHPNWVQSVCDQGRIEIDNQWKGH